MLRHVFRQSLVLNPVIPCFWNVISQSVSILRRKIFPMPTTHKCSKHDYGISFPNRDYSRLQLLGKMLFILYPLIFVGILPPSL